MKKLLKELEVIKGRHTELVSVYVPSGYSLVDVINQLNNEKSTAANIKSKNTRKNVLTALEKIIGHLRIFKQTPPNGLVVFCGNVSPDEGKEDIRIWSLEPPEKMETRIYWCDQVFVLEPLKEMIKEKEVFGLVVLDARDANIGLLIGKKIKPLKHLESTVPSKTVKGGMSQGRYDRIREDAINQFLTKVGEVASKSFLEQPELKGIIIGGPGPVKNQFLDGKYLHYQLQQKVLGVKDIGYTDEYGLELLVKRSDDLLKEAAVMKERQLLEKFLTELQKGGNVVYGFTETMKALNLRAIDILLISEDLDWVRVKLKCETGHTLEKDLPKTAAEQVQLCDQCGKEMKIEEIEELVEVLSEKVKEFGGKIEIISTETTEGKQFKELGGIGGFLRYKID
ncbi:MAG: peptide chain release factor aRF-1 [Candidatus Aenigmatarchaeota archaeon]